MIDAQDNGGLDITEFHWMLEMLHTVDVGLVVLDRDCKVRLWNRFMENHSGMRPDAVMDRSLFEAFPEIPEQWLRNKLESVSLLGNRAFLTWEQRPYLFAFRNYRPITGTAPWMYQNVTIVPLRSASTEVDHVCLIVYDVTETAVSKRALTDANAELEHLSRTDRLTGLNNRGYWEQLLEQEFRRYRRSGAVSTLVLFDIDHFKQVNDTHGHPAGDAVIRVIAETLRRGMRSTDEAGRYGGEEFAVILLDTDANGAAYFAERLRRQVADRVVEHDDLELSVTISIGVAELDPTVPDHGTWIERADAALYRSKAGGRNCVTCWSE